jgi:hypothetical protein
MPKTKHSVFISYSHKDRNTVKALTDAFNRYGISYWSDQEIRVGDNWMKEIENALNQASLFIIMVSPDFVASNWAMYEIGHAIARSKETGTKIIPLIVREGKMPALLARFQWLDARSMKPDDIAKHIKTILENKETDAQQFHPADPE